MRRATLRLLLLAGVFLGSEATAKADIIQWTYTSIPTVPLVASDDHRLGAVHLTSASGTVVGSTQLVLANLLIVSTAAAASPDTYNQKPFAIDLTITDSASKISGKVVFTGVISGSDSLFSSLLTFRITSATTQRLHLGVHIYDISIDFVTPPGPPNSASEGSIGAVVQVSHNPEPSTLLLACVGGACAGIAGWRRRRSRTAEESRPTADS